MKFHELGWPHVYDADKLFEAMPRTSDGMHFAYTNETAKNTESIISAVVRHASTLLPWEWMDIQKIRLGKVIPSAEVPNLDKLDESEQEDEEDEEDEEDKPEEPKAGEGEEAMPPEGAVKGASSKVKGKKTPSEELDEPSP